MLETKRDKTKATPRQGKMRFVFCEFACSDPDGIVHCGDGSSIVSYCVFDIYIYRVHMYICIYMLCDRSSIRLVSIHRLCCSIDVERTIGCSQSRTFI